MDRFRLSIFLFILLLFASATWLYRFQVEAMRSHVEEELTAIAQFKAQQISEWKSNNLYKVAILQRSPFLVDATVVFLKDPTPAARKELIDRFQLLAEMQGFADIFLVNTEGEELVRLRKNCPLQPSGLAPQLEAARNSMAPVFVDLHDHADGSQPHTSIVVPLFEAPDGKARPLGFLLMINEAADFLFPLLHSWPTRSITAETLLIRSEGNHAVVLNAPRVQSSTSPALRHALGDMSRVSALAASGRQGYVEDLDGHGTKVVAVHLPVPETKWSLVVKIDKGEAFAAWPYQVALPLALLAFLLTLIAVLWLYFWKSEQNAQLQTMHNLEEARREALEHEALLLRSINDGIIAVDADGRISLINTSAEQMIGWTEVAANGRPVAEVFTLVDAGTGQSQAHLVEEALSHNKAISVNLADQVVLVARDGQQCHITFSVAPVADPANRLAGAILIFRDVSESFRLREAIRQERNLFQLFIDQVPVAIAMFDRQMRYLAVSKRYMVDFKLRDRDIIGLSHYDILPFVVGRSDIHQRVLQGASEGSEEEAVQWTNGQTDWMHWAMHPWYKSDEEIGGVVFFCEVITARKKAELALETNRQRLNHLLTVSPAVIYSLRADTFAPNWVSPNISTLLGYTADEVLQPDWYAAHLYAGDRDRILSSCQVPHEGEQTVREYRLHHKSGNVLWLRDELRLLRNDQGEPVEIVGAWMDITERREAEAALERSEAKFRAIFQKHAAVKLLIDPSDGRILDANEAAVAFYGWSRVELQNMNVQDINILPPEQLSAAMEQVCRNEQVRFEFRHRLADGSMRDVAVYCSVIEIQGRLVLHTISQDITRRRQLEEHLRQAQKMESVGLLAGGVAHEFNNMLAVIIGYGQFALDRTTADNPIHDSLREILRAANYSVRITRQLLAFARQQPTGAEKFDINAAIEELLKMLGRLIGEQIELVWQPGHGELPVLMDPAQFDQILINLCLNARDAIAGTGTITITTNIGSSQSEACNGAACEPNHYAVLSVRDTGCGMDRVTRERIFEPFFTTKETGKGTGLGLSMVYGIVQQGGGYIDVTSAPGGGATFTLSLPLAEMKTTRVVVQDVLTRTMGEITILVVEDDASVLRMVQLMLTELGHQVLALDSPEEAIRLVAARGGGFDLLVTDMVMPKMNGEELAAVLQADLPDLKVLFMSGYAPRGMEIQGEEGRDPCFLQKPFGINDLALKVQEVMLSPPRKNQI